MHVSIVLIQLYCCQIFSKRVVYFDFMAAVIRTDLR